MRVDPDTAAPTDPLSGAAVTHEDIELVAADGARFATFSAIADDPRGPAVIVLADVRGLFHFYEELALRFAATGYDAMAIDNYGRTAGPAKRDDPEFDWRTNVTQTTREGVAADVRAAVEHLRSREGQSDRSVFTVGFSFGGSNSWLQATEGHGLSGVIGFYGRTEQGLPQAIPPVIEHVGEMTCPLLALMGGADPMIDKAGIDAFDDALTAADVEHLVLTYHGAPHSFFDRSHGEYERANAHAWASMLAFIEMHA